jgi:hypothetical protein
MLTAWIRWPFLRIYNNGKNQGIPVFKSPEICRKFNLSNKYEELGK